MPSEQARLRTERELSWQDQCVPARVRRSLHRLWDHWDFVSRSYLEYEGLDDDESMVDDCGYWELTPLHVASRETAMPSNYSYEDRMAQSVLREHGFEGTDYPTFELLFAPDEGESADNLRYRAQLQQAFAFYRRHGSRRYSDRTLMRLVRSDEAAQDNRTSGLPNLIIASRPVDYDEETEVKTGGTVGMLVVWPEDNKAIIAVPESNRQVGIGSALVTLFRNYLGNRLTMWVGQTNQAGHHFCISQGFFPIAITPSSVRYGTSFDESEEAGPDEGRLNRDMTPRRRLRPVAPPPVPSYFGEPTEEEVVAPGHARFRISVDGDDPYTGAWDRDSEVDWDPDGVRV